MDLNGYIYINMNKMQTGRVNKCKDFKFYADEMQLTPEPYEIYYWLML